MANWFGPVTEIQQRQARLMLARNAQLRKRTGVRALSNTMTRALRRVSSGKVQRAFDAAGYLDAAQVELEMGAVAAGFRGLFR